MLSWAHIEWHVRIVLAHARAAIANALLPDAAAGVAAAAGMPPVDVAHWLPNMPRGSEDSYGRRAPVTRAAHAPG